MSAAPQWFDTAEELERAVADVNGLSPACRTVLAGLVETQGKRVERVSACLVRLEDLGFAFLRGDPWTGTDVSPTLWCEEALETWEDRRGAGNKAMKDPNMDDPKTKPVTARLTAAQVRMGRAAVRLGVRELARSAGVSPRAVERAEDGERILASADRSIREALERAGVEFADGGARERPGAGLSAVPASHERDAVLPVPRYLGWRTGQPLETVASTLGSAIGHLETDLFSNDSVCVRAAKWDIEDACRKLSAGEPYNETHPGIDPASVAERAA